MNVSVQKIEASIVFAMVIFIAYASGSHPTDWLASAAVFLSFVCTQKTFDLAERYPSQCSSEKERDIKAIYVLKEGIWMLTFWFAGSYPLLIGAVVFATYPATRRKFRKAFNA